MKNSSNLPADWLLKIKKILEKDKLNCQFRLEELDTQDPFSDPERLNDNAASDTDASEEANHDRVSALASELKNKLTATDKALGKIINGEYGLCENCHQPIEFNRLEILPIADLCMECENINRKTV